MTPLCIILFIYLCLVPAVLAKRRKGKGKDLPPDAPVRVGSRKPRMVCPEADKSDRGDLMVVHYDATLYKTGKLFASSRNHNFDNGDRTQNESRGGGGGVPFEFRLGEGSVVAGWDQGLHGMCVGDRRILTIASQLAYGQRGSSDGRVPPGATVRFEVNLVGLRKGHRWLLPRSSSASSSTESAKEEL